MKWKNKLRWLLGVTALFGLLATPAFATSTRVTPAVGYMAHDYTFEDCTNGTRNYSAGCDIGYAELAKFKRVMDEDPALPGNDGLYSRGILHTVTVNRVEGEETVTYLDINLYTHTGELVTTLFTTTGSFPQSVRLVTVAGGTDQIWFSYTGSIGAGYFSIPWMPDAAGLDSYPVASATEQIPDVPYSWEVEQRYDGLVFVCGIAGGTWVYPPPNPGEPPPPLDPHSIYYVDQTGASVNVVQILEVGSYSSGFAFDADGNLWSGEYILGWSPAMHVEPCKLKMWSKASVDAIIALGPGYELSWTEGEPYGPDATINFGTGTGTHSSYNWGPNDIEGDPNGNVYISMNSYSSWGNETEFGAVKKYHAVENEGSWSIVCDGYISEDDCGANNLWDWHKNLCYDGESYLEDGGYSNPELLPTTITGNRLYMDMDFDCGDHNKPNQFTVYGSDADADEDGVPDSADNAPDTLNGGLNGNTANQQDTDWDMYGNACDADLDNSKGPIDATDRDLFVGAWNSIGSGLDADFNSDGVVDAIDDGTFKDYWNITAPWY